VAAARNSVYTSSLRRTKNKTAAAASVLSAQSDSEAASSKLVLDNYLSYFRFDNRRSVKQIYDQIYYKISVVLLFLIQFTYSSIGVKIFN
jgi:hypothetical protein